MDDVLTQLVLCTYSLEMSSMKCFWSCRLFTRLLFVMNVKFLVFYYVFLILEIRRIADRYPKLCKFTNQRCINFYL